MSEGFSPDWLALREGADRRARADALLAGLATRNRPEHPWLVLDLGAGTGANLRWLAPRLAAQGIDHQHWTCADHDPALLSLLPTRCAAWAATQGMASDTGSDGCTLTGGGMRLRVRPLAIDLALDPDRLPLPVGGLVTASALLDLVGADWLAALLARAAAAGCPLLFALSYDGRCELTPAHRDDARLLALFNAHQRTDKGLGPALGPTAADATAALCEGLGYRVWQAPSDWVIGPGENDLLRALLAGWTAAVQQLEPSGTDWLNNWQAVRMAQLAADTLRVRVGHRDLLALPPGAS